MKNKTQKMKIIAAKITDAINKECKNNYTNIALKDFFANDYYGGDYSLRITGASFEALTDLDAMQTGFDPLVIDDDCELCYRVDLRNQMWYLPVTDYSIYLREDDSLLAIVYPEGDRPETTAYRIIADTRDDKNKNLNYIISEITSYVKQDIKKLYKTLRLERSEKIRTYIVKFYVGDEPIQQIEFYSDHRANSKQNIRDAKLDIRAAFGNYIADRAEIQSIKLGTLGE